MGLVAARTAVREEHTPAAAREGAPGWGTALQQAPRVGCFTCTHRQAAGRRADPGLAGRGAQDRGGAGAQRAGVAARAHLQRGPGRERQGDRAERGAVLPVQERRPRHHLPGPRGAGGPPYQYTLHLPTRSSGRGRCPPAGMHLQYIMGHANCPPGRQTCSSARRPKDAPWLGSVDVRLLHAA